MNPHHDIVARMADAANAVLEKLSPEQRRVDSGRVSLEAHERHALGRGHELGDLDGAKAISLSINDAKEHVARVLITPTTLRVQRDDHDHEDRQRVDHDHHQGELPEGNDIAIILPASGAHL